MAEATCDAQTLVNASSCFACLDDDIKMGIMIGLLCQINQNGNPMASCDIQTLASAGSCFACLDRKLQWGIMIQLLCDISANGSGGGAGLCGLGSPEGVVDGPCGISYTDTTPGNEAVYHKTTPLGNKFGWI